MTQLKVKNIVLIGASVLIPVLAVVQSSMGGMQLGTWGSVGVIAAGIIAVLTNVATIWKPSEADQALTKRIIAGIGVAASVSAPVLMSIFTSLPPETKITAFVGALAGLAASLKGILVPAPIVGKPVERTMTINLIDTVASEAIKKE
jgi:hypothetical protein